MSKDKTDSHILYSYDANGIFKLLWGTLENSDNAKVLLEIDETELMNLEKERLGISRDKLVFIGIANVSKYYWCGWQCHLKSKKNEVSFFQAYFEDRLNYSKELGLLTKIPKTIEEILKIGDKIELNQIQKLLEKKKVSETSDETKEKIKNLLKKEENPQIQGIYYQELHAEDYHSIRWNFRYKDLVLIGIPDGITDDFVYEFKSTKKRYFRETYRTAQFQSNLYGHYFKRPKKKIQIYCKDEHKIYDYFEEVEDNEIIELLEKWIRMINGELPIKPESWKCNICEFKDNCVLIKNT